MTTFPRLHSKHNKTNISRNKILLNPPRPLQRSMVIDTLALMDGLLHLVQ